MAVVKVAYAAAAPWTIADVCSLFQSAFIDAGFMTAWYDSFTSGGREHRILEVIYNAAKTYGKTYYWFTFDGVGVWVRTATGWNAASDIPAGQGGAGTAYVDWWDTTTTANNGAHLLLTISTSISTTLTRYTSSGRSFFVLRSGTTFKTFTIDPASTTFRSFYDLALGYHSGIYAVNAASYKVDIQAIHRNRRDLLLGSSANINNSNTGTPSTAVVVASYSLPRNYGNHNAATYPEDGFVLPGWTTVANPSAGLNFNPVFNAIRLSSVITTDLPSDFGISTVKNSNILAIQDNATVTAGVEEYEILAFANSGAVNSITSNPVFLARTV